MNRNEERAREESGPARQSTLAEEPLVASQATTRPGQRGGSASRRRVSVELHAAPEECRTLLEGALAVLPPSRLSLMLGDLAAQLGVADLVDRAIVEHEADVRRRAWQRALELEKAEHVRRSWTWQRFRDEWTSHPGAEPLPPKWQHRLESVSQLPWWLVRDVVCQQLAASPSYAGVVRALQRKAGAVRDRAEELAAGES